MGRKIGEISVEVIALVQEEEQEKKDVKISYYTSTTNNDATRKPSGVKGCKYFPIYYKDGRYNYILYVL